MNGIRAGYVVAVLSGVAALLPAGSAQAQMGPSRFVGHWRLNTAQSKPADGETAPTNLVTDIARVDTQHVHWSTTSTDPQGQKDTETFDTPGNGEFYSLNGGTMVAHRISPTVLQSTFREQGGETDVVTCTLSADAAQMTCNGAVTHADGTTAQYSDVFDRM